MSSRGDAAPAVGARVTAIVPVHNDRDNLGGCLEALEATRGLAELEILVVDDGSTDGSGELAEGREGVGVLRLAKQGGPALARNRGVAVARHDLIFFVDADVRVRPETLALLASRLEEEPALSAVFGSYDTEPGAPNLVSQYRNLMHHYVHQVSDRRAFTFWSGCGMIRRRAFESVGGFDASYRLPSIEDIELGSRLLRAGHRVELMKEVQCRHMKHWTLWSMIRCDVLQRGIPWTLLLMREGRLPNDLNLRWTHRFGVGLACLLALTLLVGSWHDESLLLLPMGAGLAVLGVEIRSRRRVPPRRVRWAGVLGGAATLGGLVAFSATGRPMLQLWLLLTLALVAAMVILNLRFYLFLARVRQPTFVPLVIPLHILFYFYGALAFAGGSVVHLVSTARARVPQSLEDGSGPATD
ncbi:MAG: glycosyltransferase [Holophagales bacterium]|nr:glycosyltransferase [Holophagales bacterium]